MATDEDNTSSSAIPAGLANAFPQGPQRKTTNLASANLSRRVRASESESTREAGHPATTAVADDWQMIVCVRDPINVWGEGQAPLHQVKSTSCTPPNTMRPRRPKKARVRARPSRGVGGRRKIYPRPRQVKSCHVTTPIIAYVHGCP
jgi:hypothetical protein